MPTLSQNKFIYAYEMHLKKYNLILGVFDN